MAQFDVVVQSNSCNNGYVQLLSHMMRAMLPAPLLVLLRITLAVAVIVILFLATQPVDHLPKHGFGDKINHLLAFFTLAWLADFSFPATRFGLEKVFTLLGFGLLIEIIQWPLAHRTFSTLDLVADLLGVVLYIAVQPALRRTPYIGRRWAQCE